MLMTPQATPTTFRIERHVVGLQGTVYGGHLAARAVAAAGETVSSDRRLHSLHGYFLRPGDALAPADVQVELLRDGATYATREVRVVQDGTEIFRMLASFKAP